MTTLDVPLIIRGQIIESDMQDFSARSGGINFRSPDIKAHLGKLPTSAHTLRDLYSISLDEIIDFMVEVGARLDLATNPHMAAAFEASVQTSGLPRSILEATYASMPRTFTRDVILQSVEAMVGREYLEGWVRRELNPGQVLNVRAFGARSVHVIAGNSPGIAFLTVLRSAFTRSDTIIKLPSNDPMTATAILRTMVEVDADHPVTRHLSAGYWKGGDEVVEAALYQPRNIEKIVAWGGFASITHITKYLQPGIDLITLDPKHSASIIGSEALESEETVEHVAGLAALDIGSMNQELCANARVLYVVCDESDPRQMEMLNLLGERILAAVGRLPAQISTPAKNPNPELQAEIAGIEMQEDFYKLFRTANELDGAVIVSQFDEAVEFSDILYNRTANLVPVPNVEDALRRFSAAQQSVGIYPDKLKSEIRDALAIQGAQHIVSLGKVTQMGFIGPQDGLEVERRMLKWVRDMTSV